MSRAPFAPVSELMHVPIALFEILALAKEGKADEIVPLIQSVINITLADVDAWQKIAQMQPA